MAMPTLQQIIGTITGKVAFERAQANFTIIKDAHNGLETTVGTKAPNADLVAHKAENASKHIKESGSNANGKYLKFDDGTMICISPLYILVYAATTTLAIGWVFPSAFIDTNISISAGFDAPPSGKRSVTIPVVTVTNASSGNLKMLNDSATVYAPGDTAKATAIAIGRWK